MNFNHSNFLIQTIIFALLSVCLIILGAGCEKDLDITTFSKDYESYVPELRIEAVFDPVHPENSIVRIDRSIAIDDTMVFNGLDDDGDWAPFSDLNGNGKWDAGEPLNDDLGEDGIEGQDEGFPGRDDGEGNGLPDQGEPNIDEYDEILPMIHDTTAQVLVTNIQEGSPSYGNTIVFEWVSRADSFQIFKYRGPGRRNADEEDPEVETVYYGAYRLAGQDTIRCGSEYELTILSEKFGLNITGTTITIPPVEFLTNSRSFPTVLDEDTLVFVYGANGGVAWQSDIRSSVYYIKIEKVETSDSLVLEYRHPAFPLEILTSVNSGIPVGYEPLFSDILPGLYKLTVSVMNENYGKYFYSDLPLKDPEKTNLRDQFGNSVMGVVGSIADNSIFIRVQ